MMNTTVITHQRGSFYFTENGQVERQKRAFPLGCLLGVHLLVPRAFGAQAVAARLSPDGGGDGLSIPLMLRAVKGGMEEYAALLDTARIPHPAGGFALTLSLQTPRATLCAHPCEGGGVRFAGESAVLSHLLLFEEGRMRAGGATYLLPYRELWHTGALCRGEDGDFDRFFSHLAAHGVRTLLLLLPAEGEAAACEEGLALPPAVALAAAEHGVSCLLDLLPYVCLRRAGRLPAASDPTGYRLCDEQGCEDFSYPESADLISPLALFGEGGILARAGEGGYSGVFLRYADRFGDAFLRAVREGIETRWGEGAPFLLFHAATEPLRLPFDRRRRFACGVAGGVLSYTLKNALLAYLASGKTDLLQKAFGDTLSALPLPLLTHSGHLLDEVGGACFADALRERLEGREKSPPIEGLLRLSELICATVTGTPVLSAVEGAEDAFAYRLRLFGICRRERALLCGGLSLHILRPDLLIFSRRRAGEMLVVAVNRSEEPLVLSSPDGFSVLLGGRGRKGVHRVGAYAGTVLRFSLFEGEHPTLTLTHERRVTRDTRFAPRVAAAEKSS